MDLQTNIIRQLLNVELFAAGSSGLQFRSYQKQVALSICTSVLYKLGLTFVVMFPRQSGKNELQAQIEAYLLTRLMKTSAEIVKISPTWKPQSQNAMRRLERTLQRNSLIRGSWTKEQGYIFRIGQARIYFLSGSPTTNIVGATASTLLECDEAQDITIAKWDKDINPMAASTNATKVFYGTAWTSQTLLARELRTVHQAEQLDGIQRVFVITADDVRQEVPAYGAFVDSEIAKLGRDHPFIKTQYFSQEIDSETGLFPPARQALMRGNHPPLYQPIPGEIYAFLLDIAGESESSASNSTIFQDAVLKNSARDSTALTIVRLDLSLLDTLHAPVYQVIMRRSWTGDRHTDIFGQLTALANHWQPRYIVCDNTGIGAGLTSFLTKALGESRVIPFTFSQASKSKLAWDFISVIETGRFQDHAPSPWKGEGWGEGRNLQTLFWQQVTACQSEIVPGPGRIIRWSVPDGTRNPISGEPLHDDLLISAALCAVLDEYPWGFGQSTIIPGFDPLSTFGETF